MGAVVGRVGSRALRESAENQGRDDEGSPWANYAEVFARASERLRFAARRRADWTLSEPSDSNHPEAAYEVFLEAMTRLCPGAA